VTTWRDPSKVDEYLARIGRIEARREGERELIDALPAAVAWALDLGCGDGRLLSLVLDARAEISEAIGVDSSPPMLDRARVRFAGDSRVTIVEGDLRQSIGATGPFDVAISGFAIHHLTDDRKQSLLAEVATALAPGGVFANLEVVACATQELQEEFNERIDRPGGDPEDILASVEDQLSWMRAAGLVQVDCQWRWRGFALLVGTAPS